MTPKVSIIIPVYNTEKYLPQCIESVRTQTLTDIEIILVDDGSPDNSPILCDKYAQQDNRIHVVHKQNAGLGYARNSGLDVAHGEFVSFIDSDDFIAPTMMETLYNTAKKHNADEVRSGTIFYTEGKETVRHEVDSIKVYEGAERVNEFILDLIGPKPEEHRDVKYMVSVCLSIHKRSVIEEWKIRFTSERETLSEDLIFNIDMMSKMNCIVCIPDCFYYYRMNPNSLTHTFPKEKVAKHFVFLRVVFNRLNNIYKEDDFMIHFQRLTFLYLRNCLSGLARTNACYSEKKELINGILDEPLIIKLFDSYPYWRMDIKHKLYFWVLKNKNTALIYLITKLIFK